MLRFVTMLAVMLVGSQAGATELATAAADFRAAIQNVKAVYQEFCVETDRDECKELTDAVLSQREKIERIKATLEDIPTRRRQPSPGTRRWLEQMGTKWGRGD